MTALLNQLVKLLDLTVHPVIKKRGGMTLLRGRMLSLSCILTMVACLSFMAILVLNSELQLRLFFIYAIGGQSAVFLILNRYIQQNTLLSATSLILLSLQMGLGIAFQAGSIFAPGFLWFPVLILPAFLLCGWRPGLAISAVIILVALATLKYCMGLPPHLPFQGDRTIGLRAAVVTVILVSGLTLGMVTIYFHLLHDNEESTQAQRNWLQRTVRMQELLQMSGHFAVQTNGPLDVLGTALHNLEEPLKSGVEPCLLLPLLNPVESSVQELAAVSRSFSLFSRRYLEEGLEQTSMNAVLEHVDTIYNVGPVSGQARLHWEPVTPDILIHTQTAKLVMLLISVLRGVVAEGGVQPALKVFLGADGLQILLRYRRLPAKARAALKTPGDVVFDPELTEDLIQEICTDLGMVRSQEQDTDFWVQRFLMGQAQSQARLA